MGHGICGASCSLAQIILLFEIYRSVCIWQTRHVFVLPSPDVFKGKQLNNLLTATFPLGFICVMLSWVPEDDKSEEFCRSPFSKTARASLLLRLLLTTPQRAPVGLPGWTAAENNQLWEVGLPRRGWGCRQSTLICERVRSVMTVTWPQRVLRHSWIVWMRQRHHAISAVCLPSRDPLSPKHPAVPTPLLLQNLGHVLFY